MRLYNAVCAWLEANAAQMGNDEAAGRDTQLDALVETAHQYTGEPELHVGHRGTTFDDYDDRAARIRPIGFHRR